MFFSAEPSVFTKTKCVFLQFHEFAMYASCFNKKMKFASHKLRQTTKARFEEVLPPANGTTLTQSLLLVMHWFLKTFELQKQKIPTKTF